MGAGVPQSVKTLDLTSLLVCPSVLALAATLSACGLPELDPSADGGTGDSGTDDAGGTDADGAEADGADSESGVAGDCEIVTQEDLATDLTLAEGCYVVSEPLALDSTTLTVEAGADITFEMNTGLSVFAGGVLTAVGSVDNPIVMHGAVEERSAWEGIGLVGAASSSNRIEHVQIIDAGNAGNGLSGQGGAVEVSAGSRIQILNSVIEGSAGFAISTADGAAVTLSGTTVTDNARALELGISTVATIAGDNQLTGNDEDVAVVVGNTLAEDATWVAIGLPLHPTGQIYVDAAVTLEAGVTVAMAQDFWIDVRENGSLTAAGTSEAPVVLTGQLAEVGFWKGVSFASKSSSNILDGAVVEFAGGDHWHGGPDSRSAIVAYENSKVEIRNSVVRDSQWYAFTANAEADIEGFSGNRLERNARVLMLHPDLVGAIEADNEFVDNDDNVVRMAFGNNDVVITEQSWKSVGVPFHVNVRMYIEAPVTVEAGVTIEFEQEASYIVRGEGSLSLAGTEAEPVLLTGVEKVPGFWRGVNYRTLSGSNTATHTRFEYAGGGSWHGGADASGTIYVDNEGRAELSDVTIAEGAGHGIKVDDDGSSLVCAGVTFENLEGDNTYGPIPAGCQ